MPRYLVTRRRIARSPLATGPGFAWKWLYDVQRDGLAVSNGHDRIDAVRSWVGRDAHRLGHSIFAVSYAWDAKAKAGAA